ncbi:MAG: GrpB family protein [Bacilli bacterium]|nr:GrpB family protein [Bacilli bacterium]
MGLKVGEVSLESYNPAWKDDFLKEKENLVKLMNGTALTIEHIGSTAIPGLSAKPIIDISVGVNKLTDFNKVKEKFLNFPYSIKEDSPIDEILIRKGSVNNRTHFIHVMEIDSPRYKNTLLFRDYLNSNKDELLKYENLKKELAEKYHDNRIMYTSSKNDYISDILRKANKEL